MPADEYDALKDFFFGGTQKPADPPAEASPPADGCHANGSIRITIANEDALCKRLEACDQVVDKSPQGLPCSPTFAECVAQMDQTLEDLARRARRNALPISALIPGWSKESKHAYAQAGSPTIDIEIRMRKLEVGTANWELIAHVAGEEIVLGSSTDSLAFGLDPTAVEFEGLSQKTYEPIRSSVGCYTAKLKSLRLDPDAFGRLAHAIVASRNPRCTICGTSRPCHCGRLR